MVSGRSMESTLEDGDLVITREHSSYHVGEIIAYQVPDGDPMAGLRVVHRIVGGSAADGYVTRGDHRTSVDPWRPRPDDVIGSVARAHPVRGSGPQRAPRTAALRLVRGFDRARRPVESGPPPPLAAARPCSDPPRERPRAAAILAVSAPTKSAGGQ